MFSCYIIDNEEHAIELLTGYINRAPELELTGTSIDPVEGLHTILHTPPDILFLDVDMPVLSGFDVYKLLDGKCTVVFTTAFPKYAVDAYTVDAQDFLLKPIRFERFLQCIQKITAGIRSERKESGGKDFIFVQSESKSKLVKVLFEGIIYIEGLHNYLVIHTVTAQHTIYISLKEILDKLPAGDFCRIHRSFIVNYMKISSLEGNRLWMEGGTELAIGPQYKESFFEKVRKDQLKK